MRYLLPLLLVVGSYAQIIPNSLCGIPQDGKTVYLPANYGTLAMPNVGQVNSITDDQYGCQVWKVADMSVHNAGPTAIDSQDRWVVTHNAKTGNVPGNWFYSSGWYVHDLFTGSVVCTLSISGAGGYLWGLATGDQDNLYFHYPPSQIYKLNVPACIAGTGMATLTSPWVTLYDSLKDPVTGVQLYANLMWCQDASDFSADGDHLCIGNDAKGGFMTDPRRYTVSTKTVSPPMTGSPHQPAGCVPYPSDGNCYRGGFLGPSSNQMVVAYETVSGTADHYLDLFDGATGIYIRTLNNFDSHGTLATWAGQDYDVDDVNGLDPQQPPNCNPGFQAIKLSDGTRTCLLNKSNTGPNGGRDYEEPHLNGRGTDGGNPYVAVDVIDYVYDYSAAYTFANLPNPGSGTVLLTDAVTSGNCSAGGGTNEAFCEWNGTYKYWFPVSTASDPLQFNWSSNLNWGPNYNEIYFLYLDGETPRHMVHHRSMSVEPLFGGAGVVGYWSSPRVAVSRSGNYMVWDSTWGLNDNISVYAARIKCSCSY